jgi:hypothetical protein
LPGGIKFPGNGAYIDPGVNPFNHSNFLFFIQSRRVTKPLSLSQYLNVYVQEGVRSEKEIYQVRIKPPFKTPQVL